MTDRIQKSIDIAASRDRVWRALVDSRQFGTWFRVDLDGPFVVGAKTTGAMTYPGYEGIPFEVEVVRIDEEAGVFAFRWVPYAIDPDADYSGEPTTLVEFRLEPVGDGTRVTVIESGFEALSPDRRDEAMRSNEGGWEEQMRNVRTYVED